MKGCNMPVPITQYTIAAYDISNLPVILILILENNSLDEP